MVGKPNETFKNLHLFLSKRYHVQVSTDDMGVLTSIMQLINPDLILISLVGISDIDTRIFRMLDRKCYDTPIITIGTQKEWERLLRYYDAEHFTNLIRPIDNSDVMRAIGKSLRKNREVTKAHILVVDDDGAMLRMLRIMLSDKYDVTLANSGTRAVGAIGADRPDVIILDYDMPVCDGKQTLEMIRSDEEMSDIPVIFLTSFGDRKHIEAVLKLEPTGYLLKPPQRDTLIKEIEKALAKAPENELV